MTAVPLLNRPAYSTTIENTRRKHGFIDSNVASLKQGGLRIANGVPMSSSEFIYKKMASLEQSGAGRFQETAGKFDAARQMPRTVVHELNNILTIIQGYADRLLLKHGEDPTLQPQLRMIFESARRAAVLIREAAPQAQNVTHQQNLPPPPSPA
jgi:signal transduction histidine kinase